MKKPRLVASERSTSGLLAYPERHTSHAERFNRNLRSALIAYHAQQQNTWDESLKWLQMAFNSATHESHKRTPYEVIFGQAPNNPLSNLWTLGDLLPAGPGEDVSHNWEAARKNLLKAHRRLRERYDKGRKENPFVVGDLVFCKAHPVSSAVNKVAAKPCH